jgi:6,7-dimethyl-8-ribityllumazine synthase
MASKLKNLSSHTISNDIDGKSFSVGVIVSEYHENITGALLQGCIETLLKHGVDEKNIVVDFVPGAYELPSAAALFLQQYEFNAVICLGCVIKGDTDHDQYINQAVSNELMRLSTEMLTPVSFGLLTTNDLQQALDRSGGKHGNKGEECAMAALKMAALYQRHDVADDDASLYN